MLHILLAAAALGLAGFDPVGVIALVAAMAIGAGRRAILTLMLATITSTFLFGLVPALTVGPAVWRLSHAMGHVGHTVWGPLTIALGVGLALWGVIRLLRPGHPVAPDDAEGHAAPRSTRPGAMALAGLMVGLSAFLDPAFYAMVVFAARQPHPATSALVVLVWVLLSHCLLVLVGGAALLGLYQPVHRLIEHVRERWSRPLAMAGSVALVAVGLFCIAEGIAEWHGHWLLFEDVREGLHLPRRRR